MTASFKKYKNQHLYNTSSDSFKKTTWYLFDSHKGPSPSLERCPYSHLSGGPCHLAILYTPQILGVWPFDLEGWLFSVVTVVDYNCIPVLLFLRYLDYLLRVSFRVDL